MDQHAMLACIKDEAGVIKEILENKEYYTKELVHHFMTHDVKRVYISGHGSPYNVGDVLRYMMEHLLQVEVSVDYASLFLHHLSFNANGVYQNDEMLLICPAQSGKTKGPVDTARKARSLGIPVVCTTLLRDGVLANTSDIVIVKRSGQEESFPETKGHMASLAILMLAAIEIANAKGNLQEQQYQAYLTAFEAIPKHLEESIRITQAWYETHKKTLLQAKDFTFIGYGENYATAVEGSLKILETTLKPCLSYECEEYMHGQNQPVDKDSILFMIASKGKELARIHSLASWCRSKGALVYVVGSCTDDTLTPDDIALPVCEVPYLPAIEYLLPFQLLGYAIAKDMGLSSIVAHHDDAGKELGVRYE